MPIQRLPTDILLIIFDLIYESLDFSAEPIRIWHNVMAKGDAEVKWKRLLGVCRRWRDVIVGTPQYWRIINVYSRPDWLNLCLSRSAGRRALPVSIYFRDSHCSPSLVPLLSQPRYVSYIGLLSFDLGTQSLDALCNMFIHTRFPNLLTVNVRAVVPSAEPIQRYLGLSAERQPRLADLTLTAIRPPSDLRMYENLRALKLSSYPWDASFEDLLKLLAACSGQLERLELRGIVPLVSTTASQHQERQIVFPNLKKAHFSHAQPRNAHILSFLRFPSATDVSLIDDVSKLQSNEFQNLDAALSALLPTDPTPIIPFLSAITEVEFRAWRTDYVFVGKSESGHPCLRLQIFRYAAYPVPWDGLTALGLADLTQLLSRARVTCFDIKVDFETLAQEDWDSAFEAFPDLECLRLSGQGGFEDVFDSLYPYSDADGVIETS